MDGVSITKTTVEILVDARDLLSAPDRWTKGTFACDYDGNDTFPDSDDAVCFCAYGAVQRCMIDGPWDRRVVLALEEAIDGSNATDESGVISVFNDAPRTTHADILAMFDRAIAAERGKQ